MTPEEKQRFDVLCALIAKEQDHNKFMELVLELNDLLERKQHRLGHPDKPKPS